MMNYWLRFRLRAYAVMTGHLLKRHWQAVVLATLAISPLAMPMMEQVQAVGTPILSLLSGQHSLRWYGGYVLILEATGVLWATVQRSMILGGDFTKYVTTLPMPPLVRRRVDVCMLLLANSIPLIPAIAALTSIGAAPLPASQKVSQCAVVVVLSSVIFAAQLCVLTRQWVQLLGVAVANLLVMIALASQAASIVWSCQIFSLLIAVALIVKPPMSKTQDGHRTFADKATISMLVNRVVAIFPVAYLEVKILVAARPWSTFSRLSLTGAVAIGINALIHVEKLDERAVPTVILLLPVTALLLSGFYRVLVDIHNPMASYLQALPVPPGFWSIRDTVLVILISLPFTTFVIFPLLPRGISTAITIIVLHVVLIALLRITQLRQQQSVLWSTVAAAIWSVALWQLLV